MMRHSRAATGVVFFVVTSLSGYAEDGLSLPPSVHRNSTYTVSQNAPQQIPSRRNVVPASFEQPAVLTQPGSQGSGFPSLKRRPESDVSANSSSEKSFGPLVTTSASLAVVLGLFAGLVWLSRKYGNGGIAQSAVPNDVLKNLGSTMIDARTRVTLLQCGNRIIVMAQTQGGVHPLAEITDPAEVDRLVASCTGQSHESFAEALHQAAPRDTGGLFASA